MGTLFKYCKEWWLKFFSVWTAKAVPTKINNAVAVPKPASPPSAAETAHAVYDNVEDTKTPLLAPEVSLREVLPNFAEKNLNELLHRDCWSFLLVPEEEVTRWFAIFADHLEEIGRTPVAEHDSFMSRLSSLTSGAVSLDDGLRFRIEDFRSFNEFGDRYALQFFKEGAFNCDESIQRRRDNIRLINRLKPADTVTIKNEDDLAKAVLTNKIASAYLDHLQKDGLLSPEQRAAIRDDEAELLTIMRSINIPRKMAAIALAHCLNVEYIEIGEVYFDKSVTHLVSMGWKQEHQVFPYKIDKDQIFMAMADPSDREAVNELEQVSRCQAIIYCSAARDIANMIKKAHKDDILAAQAADPNFQVFTS
ncbi:MAG: hypothetical protein Q4F00_13400 [bacterium]|nr:hypothetical protein [bacterium]